MATVTIILTDDPDGSVDVKANFDGPMDPDSGAHGLAAEFILRLHDEENTDD